MPSRHAPGPTWTGSGTTRPDGGVDQADRYVRQIIHACADLAHGRSVGQVIDHVCAGYFRHASGSHVLFYRWNGGRRMEEIRILHRRMEFGRHLLAIGLNYLQLHSCRRRSHGDASHVCTPTCQ